MNRLDSTDRFPGHPDSVDTLAVNPLDDSELMTGSADGLVRQINILPNRFVGVVGAHDQGAGVEQVAFVQLGSAAGNGDDENQWALSCGGDCAINLWNLGQDEEEEEEEEEEEDDEDNIAEEVAAATSGSDHDDGDDDDTNNSSDGHNTETPAATTKTRKQKKSAEAGSSSAEDSSTSSNDDDDDDDSSDDDKPQRLSRKKKRQKLKTAALALSSNKQHAHKSFFSGLD